MIAPRTPADTEVVPFMPVKFVVMDDLPLLRSDGKMEDLSTETADG